MLLRRSPRPTKRGLQNLRPNKHSKSKNAMLQLLKKLVIVQILVSEKTHKEQQKNQQRILVLQLKRVVLMLVLWLRLSYLKSARAAAQLRL
jgi:hypothetical protein